MDESDFENGDTQYMTGVDYSVLLVRYTSERLYETNQEPPTYQHIAEHLGTTADKVNALLRGEKILFGIEPFQQVAAQNSQTISALQRDLIKWKIGRTGPDELLL